MAQILYMLVDKSNDDPYQDCQCYKRGDVVSVREDEDNPYEKDPGIQERLGTMFGVFRVPGKASDYSSLVVPELGDPKSNRVLQRRAFKLDIDMLLGKAVPVKDETDVKQVATAKDMLDAKVVKEPLKDPGILGDATSESVL